MCISIQFFFLEWASITTSINNLCKIICNCTQRSFLPLWNSLSFSRVSVVRLNPHVSSLLESIFYKPEAHIWNVQQYPSQLQTTVQTMAVPKSSCRVKERTDYRDHTIWCYSFYSLGPKCLSFLFQRREKIGEGKISKALATPKAPLPMSWYCFNTTVSFSRNKSEGKISRKKKSKWRTSSDD